MEASLGPLKEHFWHAIQVEETLKLLATSYQNGLSIDEVKSRQKQYGLNELPKEKTSSFYIIFLRQFKSPLIFLLLIAAGIAFSVGHKMDAQVILIVLMTNALIGSLQEGHAQTSMEALRKMTLTTVKVLRNQQEKLIDSKELVPGDILLLNEGDAVETLGSTNIICTDKTGTLTRNEMTVTEILCFPREEQSK